LLVAVFHTKNISFLVVPIAVGNAILEASNELPQAIVLAAVAVIATCNLSLFVGVPEVVIEVMFAD
jgi:hypothetical protein